MMDLSLKKLFFLVVVGTMSCIFCYGFFSTEPVLKIIRDRVSLTWSAVSSTEKTGEPAPVIKNQDAAQKGQEHKQDTQPGMLSQANEKPNHGPNAKLQDNPPKVVTTLTAKDKPSTPAKPKPKTTKASTASPRTTKAKTTKAATTTNSKNKPKTTANTIQKVLPVLVTPTLVPPMNKNDFKKMPEWDFEDIYLREPQPRQTTCPESIMASEDPEFKKAFVPDIQIFMQKEHFSRSEWNRLVHFNNPFGFMGGNYTQVKEAIELIPKLKDYQLLPVPKTDPQGCIRCAVVGNGGILNGSRKGEEIDSHDYVFRMNGAVIKGYEDDVGKKTSVYIHTAHSLTTSLYLFKKAGFDSIPHDEGIKYVMIPEGMRDFQWLTGLLRNTSVAFGPYRNRRPWKEYAGQFDINRFYVLHPDFLRYVKNRFMKSKQLEGPHWHIFRPTNGAFTLFLALHVCDVVDAYGFITEDHNKYPNYYCEKAKTRVIFYINHDYNLEIKTWKKLHDTKILKLYQRKDEPQQHQKP
ncbi:alpha-N-acetylgalactosaminide alpha-2,6-sialyltransferase 2 [Amia ocellicauda]|uniref:alpha-N-acetylgalactosaminide alpha-2,6-sialyltransferase 2 n=1 Tax=Amia ocellicauda TaxID=2972642 RepID=UPI003464DEAF